MDILSEFSDRLSEQMLLKGVKSDRMGKELGISGSAIRHWLNKKRQIGLTNLAKLADYFGCTMDFLAGRSESEMKFSPIILPPFPQALRKVMTERGFTRYSLDRDTKFKDAYMYKWDHGAVPDLFTLIELADLFDITIDYLVGRED